jgi:hypothetical protein
VLENITLEPVLFFVSFVGSMDMAAVGQLVIDKSCHIDFDFSEEICDNLLNETYKPENKQVQDEVAQFKVSLTCQPSKHRHKNRNVEKHSSNSINIFMKS